VIAHELEAAKRLIFYVETKEKSCSDLQNRATILLHVWDILSRKKSCSDLWKSVYDLRDTLAGFWV